MKTIHSLLVFLALGFTQARAVDPMVRIDPSAYKELTESRQKLESKPQIILCLPCPVGHGVMAETALTGKPAPQAAVK